MVNAYNKLTIESGMSVDSVHTEMILKGLIRSTEDILQPPDFNNPDKMNDYQILTVSKALTYSPRLHYLYPRRIRSSVYQTFYIQ